MSTTNPVPAGARQPQDHQPPRPRRLGTFAQAAREQRVSVRTMRNYAAKRYVTLYRQPGRRGVVLDLDEVQVALSRLPARLAKASTAAYGGAPIVDLPVPAVSRGDQ